MCCNLNMSNLLFVCVCVLCNFLHTKINLSLNGLIKVIMNIYMTFNYICGRSSTEIVKQSANYCIDSLWLGVPNSFRIDADWLCSTLIGLSFLAQCLVSNIVS